MQRRLIVRDEKWCFQLRAKFSTCLPADKAVGVEAGASSGEDVKEGMDGGGGVTQVHNNIYKVLRQKRQKVLGSHR